MSSNYAHFARVLLLNGAQMEQKEFLSPKRDGWVMLKNAVEQHVKTTVEIVLVSHDRERLRDFWKNTTVLQEITQPSMVMCYY